MIGGAGGGAPPQSVLHSAGIGMGATGVTPLAAPIFRSQSMSNPHPPGPPQAPAGLVPPGPPARAFTIAATPPGMPGAAAVTSPPQPQSNVGATPLFQAEAYGAQGYADPGAGGVAPGGGVVSGPDMYVVQPTPQRKQGTKKDGKTPKIEVNNFEFPELGKEKEQPPPQPKGNAVIGSPGRSIDGSASSGRRSTRGKGRQAKERLPRSGTSTPKGGRVGGNKPMYAPHSSSGVAPPGFQPETVPSLSSQDVPLGRSGSTPEPEVDLNTTGEIRATAKAFVPTFFTPPAAAPAAPSVTAANTNALSRSNSVSTPQSAVTTPALAPAVSPPGIMSSSGASTAEQAASAVFSGGLGGGGSGAEVSAEATAAALLEPVSSLLASAPPPQASAGGGSLLPGVGAAPSSFLGGGVARPVSFDHGANNPSTAHSPVHSAASSITGFSGAGGMSIGADDPHKASVIGSIMSFDSHQSGGVGAGIVSSNRTSSLLDTIGISTSGVGSGSSAPLGGIEGTGGSVPTSVAASSIWGGGAASNAAPTGLGGLSAFGFRDDSPGNVEQGGNGGTSSGDGNNTDTIIGGGTWGGGGALNTGGSIW